MEETENRQESQTMEERIRLIMESQGMNQQMFSDTTGIAPASLSNIFNGRTRATNNHTNALHRAFPNLNINWLLFGEGEMFGRPVSSVQTEPLSSKVAPQRKLAEGEQQGLFSEEPKQTVSPVRERDAPPQPLRTPAPKMRKIAEIRVFYDDGTFEAFKN